MSYVTRHQLFQSSAVTRLNSINYTHLQLIDSDQYRNASPANYSCEVSTMQITEKSTSIHKEWAGVWLVCRN